MIASNDRLKWPLSMVLVTIILVPVMAGLSEILLAAMGFIPALGQYSLSFDAWHQLIQMPGLGTSLRLTLVTGFGATAISLVMALVASCWLYDGLRGRWLRAAIVPILAAPHAAMAIGLAFLIAPSGWLARLFSPWLTGWHLPPDLAIVNDLAGLSLILGLVVKEVPFLLLVCLAALSRLSVAEHLKVAKSLGYQGADAWFKLVVPALYPLIRLPVFVVLVYSLSNVDMALILAPSTPPTLAVATMRWFYDADIQRLLPASAAAITLLVVMVLSVLVWEACVSMLGMLNRHSTQQGLRGTSWLLLQRLLVPTMLSLCLLGLLSLLVLIVWSLTWQWPYPNALPTVWSLRHWSQLLGDVLPASLAIALLTSCLASIMSIAWLQLQENAAQQGRFEWSKLTLWLIYVPLLVPQIAFLYGLKVSFLRVGINGGMGAVIWAHVLFVFPYVMLMLQGPWQAFDQRYVHVAASLSKPPWQQLWQVKIPLLLRPILLAWAVGIAVSISQYLATIMIGAGRIDTLTTEAISLASGADRRLTGMFGLLQLLIPLLAFVMAMLLPRMMYGHINQRAAP
ncbi:MAG: ABC transporter permease subunit [Oceanospirillaceae bacterium]|jgi:putative thiamine transport system permease protein|nr:ABC transporter permease subunit [Oceanospirillaceae bacterium]MBT4444200.1 ABC transporter permease subunit [Oceanospirillaceae bacterium]MBT6078232.1 ABC transporter permease subunit [Oceanospirillaceae bacterium]